MEFGKASAHGPDSDPCRHGRRRTAQQTPWSGVSCWGSQIQLKISEAVEKGFVLADEDTTKPGGDLNHETKTYQLKSVVNPVTRERLDVADAIKQGLLDEHKGIYINPKTGERLTIPEAIERKLIDAELMSVVSNT